MLRARGLTPGKNHILLSGKWQGKLPLARRSSRERSHRAASSFRQVSKESQVISSRKTFLVSICALMGLAACQAAPSQPSDMTDQAGPQTETLSPQGPQVDYQAEPGLTPTARLRKVVSFLETGDAARAEIELEAYEAGGSDRAIAAYWRKQIDGDPEAIFEADGTIHKVRPGESLSTISRKYLGDPLQFYLLARFNEIENPRQIVAGQEIRIPKLRAHPPESEAATAQTRDPAVAAGYAPVPVTDPGIEPQASDISQTEAPSPAEPGAITAKSGVPFETEPGGQALPSAPARSSTTGQINGPSREDRVVDDSVFETPPEAFDEAAESAEQGQMENAIALLEDGLKRYPGNQKVRRAAVLAYAKHGKSLLASGKPEQAAVTLAKAADLDPDDPTIIKQLQEVRNRIQAEAFYQKGLGLRDGGDTEAALAAFGKALEFAPDFRDAREQLTALQSELVDRLQRQAIVALRQEDYPAALGLWERVLAIDPTNGTADRYYRHTLELQGRQTSSETE